MAGEVNLHASCVAFGEQAVLIQGEPGSGKSTLALELIEQSGNGLGAEMLQATLVADDRTLVHRLDGALVASAPVHLQGKIEVRGLGIVETARTHRQATIAMVVKLQPSAPRLPDEAQVIEILGLKLPLVVLQSGSGGLPSRVRTALLRIKSAVAQGR